MGAADTQFLDRLVLAALQTGSSTGQRPWRVAQLAGHLAAESGISSGETDLVRRAAHYHDIGRIGIGASLFAKPGPLTPVERRLVEGHTTLGHRILSGRSAPVLQLAAHIALTHHERWDGHGYPSRLLGTDIPFVGRIVAVAEAWEALTSDRPYRMARTEWQAMTELGRHAGTQFDANVVDALFRVLKGRAAKGPERSREVGCRGKRSGWSEQCPGRPD